MADVLRSASEETRRASQFKAASAPLDEKLSMASAKTWLPGLFRQAEKTAGPQALGMSTRKSDPGLPTEKQMDMTRQRSDSGGATQRFRAIIKEDQSVLNRGLGGFRGPAERPVDPDFVEESFFSNRNRVLIYGILLTAPLTVLVEVRWGRLATEPFWQQDLATWSDGLTCLAAIPLTCAAVNFLLQHIRKTTFFWSKDTPDTGHSYVDPLARSPMVIVVLGLCRSACPKLIQHGSGARVAFYFEAMLYMICLSIYFKLLDYVDAGIKGMTYEQECLNKAPAVSKMQNLVKNITRTGKPEKDVVYAFAKHNTVPAEVLSYVWWLYYIVGKVLGTITLTAVLMGWNDGVITRSLAGGLLLSMVTASSFLFELGPNTLSLFRLALHKPFYVGDLLTVNTSGAMNSPETSIMGFVENITMMYVVIRNFEMKQTWIPHKIFSAMIIQNWTRRPSKTVLLNIGISCRCPVKKVEALKNFGFSWIEKSPEIQQKNYRKCHITKTGNGYNIEVIFFPGIGVSHRGIRQKFLVAFMEAAERMQIPFVPLQIITDFPDISSTAPKDFNPYDIPQDAIFDDLLPHEHDLLPKGVGMGFKQFPENRETIEIDGLGDPLVGIPSSHEVTAPL